MYKNLILPILFLFDAEKVHRLVCELLKIAFKIPFLPEIITKYYTIENPSLEREVFGLKFKNAVGLAAGFDKNADLIDEFSALGFGFIEIGTVTPKPQDGNDKPRLFRLKPDEAIVNRMGFNNDGAAAAAQRLRRRTSPLIVGGNIGKNKGTPNENALDDYLACFHELYDLVDYFVVNVSSPNTPNLRQLQEKEPLMAILKTLQLENEKKVFDIDCMLYDASKTRQNPSNSDIKGVKTKPILLKIAPDLSNSQLDDIIEIVIASGIAGVIATNTTIDRQNLKTDSQTIESAGAGGLSGQPLTKRSTEVIRYIANKSNQAFPIIGVGGIGSPNDAIEKLKAGASLVQIYTGFIYEGPNLIKQINRAILAEKIW